MAGESKLPMAQQERRARLAAEADTIPPTPAATPESTAHVTEPKVVTLPARPEPAAIGEPSAQTPAQPQPQTPEPATPAPTPAPQSADVAALQAELTRLRQSQELLQLELAEARAQPLTAAPDPSKGSPMGETSAPVAAVLSPLDAVGDVAFTQQEQEDFGEAEPAITKVARREIQSLIKKPLEEILARLETLERSQTTTSQRVTQVATEGFIGQVKKQVPEFDSLVTHAQWPSFLDGVVPLSGGVTFKEALTKAHNGRKLQEVTDIFGAFKKHIGAENAPDTSGYASVSVNSGVETPATPVAPTKLKMSERRQAGEDFIKGRITREELDAVVVRFRDAEAKGLIDYDN